MFFTKKKEEKYIQEIANLKHEMEELKQIIKTRELLALRAENERLREKEALISKVKIMLKDAFYLTEKNAIVVKYFIPNIEIAIDDDNKIVKNDMFYAINKLQMLPIKDMQKLQSVIDNIPKDK